MAGHKGLLAKAAAAIEGKVDRPAKSDTTSRKRPATSPGAAAFMQPTIDSLNESKKAAEARVATLEQELADAPSRLRISELVLVPGRKRRLSDEEYDALKANLAVAGQVHAVTIWRNQEGLWELVSGYNRVEILQGFGEEWIKTSAQTFDTPAHASAAAFWANLRQSKLSDYQQYLGFSQLKDELDVSQNQLARDAGISKAQISNLMLFSSVPPEVHEFLREHPFCLGANALRPVIRACEAGRIKEVMRALADLAEGEITQKQLASRIAPPSPPSPEPIAVRAGRSKSEFCSYLPQSNRLTITFKTADERQTYEERIAALLAELADENG